MGKRPHLTPQIARVPACLLVLLLRRHVETGFENGCADCLSRLPGEEDETIDLIAVLGIQSLEELVMPTAEDLTAAAHIETANGNKFST